MPKITIRPPLLVVSLLLTLALSACTIYIRPGGPVDVGVSLNDVIAEFQPTRGDGATYYVGDEIEFRVRTRESGYLTLSAIDPDGRVYVFARNIRVSAGSTEILPTREMRVTFNAAPPRGFHRIRASFTSGRTDPSRVSYIGRYGDGSWTSAIQVDIGGYDVRDVAQTTLTIR